MDRLLFEHDKWERVPDEDIPAVKNIEAREHILRLSTPGSVWACSLCVNWDASGEEESDKIKAHLLEKYVLMFVALRVFVELTSGGWWQARHHLLG